MNLPVITAGGGHDWENLLVAELDRPGSGLTIARRCVDIADVLTAASTGAAAAVVVAADLRRLDTEAVSRLQSAGIAVVGVFPAADTRASTRLGRVGIVDVVPDDTPAAALAAAIRAAVAGQGGLPPGDPRRPFPGDPGHLHSDPRRAFPPPGVAPAPGDTEPPAGSAGRVVAVWGPTGAPGRTTVAAGLAGAAAGLGIPTLLVDADVYGGLLAGAFGLLDESPGLAGACRMAAAGRLGVADLARLCWAVTPTLRLLTGISRADRWPEVRPSAVPALVAGARALAALTVIDCSFCLETDEELSFDTTAPRRNGATLAVLDAADVVLAVGSADPPGMERLVRGLAELADLVPGAEPKVVLNRVRRSAAGADEAAAALARFAGADVVATLPEDRAATDAAWKRGVALAEASAGSPLVAGLRALAKSVAPHPVATGVPR